LRNLPLSSSSNRPHSENTANNNQSPNKVTRSQSATSSGSSQGRRRYSHGSDKGKGKPKHSLHWSAFILKYSTVSFFPRASVNLSFCNDNHCKKIN